MCKNRKFIYIAFMGQKIQIIFTLFAKFFLVANVNAESENECFEYKQRNI